MVLAIPFYRLQAPKSQGMVLYWLSKQTNKTWPWGILFCAKAFHCSGTVTHQREGAEPATLQSVRKKRVACALREHVQMLALYLLTPVRWRSFHEGQRQQTCSTLFVFVPHDQSHCRAATSFDAREQ